MKKLAPTFLVVGLLVATATAFAVTERLKLEDSPVINTKIDHQISPVCTACKADARSAKIGFRLRREELIRLDVANSAGTIVRHAVGSGVVPATYRAFAWDGRDDSGRVVPDGIYKAELRLVDESRTFEFPDEIHVDATAPVVEKIELSRSVFSPDGDGRADRIDVRYRLSEKAFPILYVDGKPGPHGRKLLAGTIQWYGRRAGKGLPPGEHRLALVVKDPVGNVAPSTREFTVRIRYVELFQRRYVARSGRLRVRVSTDATTVRWRLGGRSGTVTAKRGVHALVLPVPRRPGRYLLRVSVDGHSATATVIRR